MRLVSLVILFCCAFTYPLSAQNNFAWWNSEVKQDLHLSEAQEKQIREIVSSYRSKLIDARANVQKAEGI